MALPTQKRSKSRQKRRQYQYRLKKIYLSVCPKCKKPKQSHQTCPFCGTYMGKEIIKPESERGKNRNKKEVKEPKKKKEKIGQKEKKLNRKDTKEKS